MIIDPTTAIGKLRLRTGDFLDIPILTDEVYQVTLTEKGGNINNAARLCAQYILASLAFGTHERLGVLEVYGDKIFDQYVKFLMMTIKDPAFSGISPIPYTGNMNERHPIIAYTEDFNANYRPNTQSEDMTSTAYRNETPSSAANI